MLSLTLSNSNPAANISYTIFPKALDKISGINLQFWRCRRPQFAGLQGRVLTVQVCRQTVLSRSHLLSHLRGSFIPPGWACSNSEEDDSPLKRRNLKWNHFVILYGFIWYSSVNSRTNALKNIDKSIEKCSCFLLCCNPHNPNLKQKKPLSIGHK